MTRGGWNPDAVAPPMKGGIYEREAPARRGLGWLLVGAALILVLVGLQALKH